MIAFVSVSEIGASCKTKKNHMVSFLTRYSKHERLLQLLKSYILIEGQSIAGTRESIVHLYLIGEESGGYILGTNSNLCFCMEFMSI